MTYSQVIHSQSRLSQKVGRQRGGFAPQASRTATPVQKAAVTLLLIPPPSSPDLPAPHPQHDRSFAQAHLPGIYSRHRANTPTILLPYQKSCHGDWNSYRFSGLRRIFTSSQKVFIHRKLRNKAENYCLKGVKVIKQECNWLATAAGNAYDPPMDRGKAAHGQLDVCLKPVACKILKPWCVNSKG